MLDAEIQKSHQIKEDTEEKAFLSSASEDQLEPERYWSWSKLTRVSAQVDRFIENCCLPVALTREGSLQTDEVISAGRWFIRPVLDEDGILQFDGRLCSAECLPWQTRYPIIPRSYWVTTLIIKQAYQQTQHVGTNQVLAQLSVHYWIVSAREAIKEWEKECMQCRRRKATPAKQIVAPLPELRTRKSLGAFSQASVDLGGPFTTKQGRGKTIRRGTFV